MHDRWGSTSNPSINGRLHYPADFDRPLNESVIDKTLQYRTDCNIRPSNSISFMSSMVSTSGLLHCEFVLLYIDRLIGKLTGFFASSGVHLTQKKYFHYRRVAFSSHLKSKVVNILAKSEALRINLNIDDTPIVSRSHTHPSHSQTTPLWTSSLSLGFPVPHFKVQ